MAAYKKRTEGNVSNEKFAEIECEIECNIASAENVNNPIFTFGKVQDGAKTYIDKNYSKGIRIIYNGMWGNGYCNWCNYSSHQRCSGYQR